MTFKFVLKSLEVLGKEIILKIQIVHFSPKHALGAFIYVCTGRLACAHTASGLVHTFATLMKMKVKLIHIKKTQRYLNIIYTIKEEKNYHMEFYANLLLVSCQ